jgi:hypothetical protein
MLEMVSVFDLNSFEIIITCFYLEFTNIKDFIILGMGVGRWCEEQKSSFLKKTSKSSSLEACRSHFALFFLFSSFLPLPSLDLELIGLDQLGFLFSPQMLKVFDWLPQVEVIVMFISFTC